MSQTQTETQPAPLAPAPARLPTIPTPLSQTRTVARVEVLLSLVAVAATLAAQMSLLAFTQLSLTLTLVLGVAIGASSGLALRLTSSYIGARRLSSAVERAFDAESPADTRPHRRADIADVVEDLVLSLRRRAHDAEADARHQRDLALASASGVVDLVTAMVSAEERVRGHMVADLHDTVAQELLVAIYQADELAARVDDAMADPEELAALVEEQAAAEVAKKVRETEQTLRQLMRDARPPELTVGDLSTAISGLVRDLNASSELEVRVTLPDQPVAMPMAWASTVYRFCQEALRNVVKHAQTDSAELTFSLGDGVLRVVVADHGKGFAHMPEPTTTGRHVGLVLMAQRVGALGGRVQTQSAPGQGTTVTLDLPLPRRPRNAG